MADQIAQVALETLRDLLIEEARFLYGVNDQVEEIQSELRTIHGFLKDADARPDRYNLETVHKYIKDLKDLALRAENVLENYAAEVTSQKRAGRKTLKQKLKRYACILSECSSVHQTGNETQSIRSRMAKLTKELKSMPSSSGDDAQQQQLLLLRQTYAHEVEENFVGMEKDIVNLVSLIKDDKSRSNRVISICGMGGLGKTTLARKIYLHKELQTRFQSRAWVCLSQQFQTKNVLQQILQQIVPEEKSLIMYMEQTKLVEKLYDVQKKKKCLVVIDDIWETGHWDILRKQFPISEFNCKVLLTTRNENIASEGPVYKLDYLTEDQGWELLQKIALPNFHSQDAVLKSEAAQFEAIGRKIVQKCGRLPLAISVTGGSLCGKQTLSEWEKVSNNIDTCLKHGEGANENDKRVRQVLDLSYTVLPYYLKPCFLYLGCFQEDKEIDTERLYLLWMAEGLISSEDRGSNETLRDVAQRYLSELALRCMVQVKHESDDSSDSLSTAYNKSDSLSSTYNKFISCRLHDLMRDLCLSKTEEEGFVKVMDLRHDKHYSVPSIGTIRRLAIHLDYVPEEIFDETKESKSLRSLLILVKCNHECISSKPIIFTNLKKMKFMRILILEGCNFEDQELPSEVGKLVHLRCLSLYRSTVRDLPASICDLPYLHTLDLRVMSTIRLPNLIHKMKKLRHLFLRDWSVNGDELLILDGLKELETLVLGLENSIRIEDLPKLTNLRSLQARFNGNENLSIIVNHMDQLREADIKFWDCNFSDGEEGSALLRKMLMWQSFFKLEITGEIGCNLPPYQTRMCTNLVQLELANTKIEGVDVMEVVGKFPMLKSLRLRGEVSVNTNIMICRASDFPQLKFLYLLCMSNLEKLEVEQGAMPNLSSLIIDGCCKLEMIPDGLRFITTLQRLESNMPKQFNDRLRVVNGEAGPDYHKVSHIPFIDLHEGWVSFRPPEIEGDLIAVEEDANMED